MLKLEQVMKRGGDKLVGQMENYGALRDAGGIPIAHLHFGKLFEGAAFNVVADEAGAAKLVAALSRSLHAFDNRPSLDTFQRRQEASKRAAAWLRGVADRIEAGETFYT